MRGISIRSFSAAVGLLVLISGCSAVTEVPVVQQAERQPQRQEVAPNRGEPAITEPGSECAAQVIKTPEHEPENAAYNSYVPTTDERTTLPEYFGPELQAAFDREVDGSFTGTTDEIFQFYACKYGLDVDLVRAAAWTESSHSALMNGDRGESWGIMQVKDTSESHSHAHPAARLSTSYNVDYWAFLQRGCLDGKIEYVGEKSKNDTWGCIGLWYIGADTDDPRSADYIGRVQKNYRKQPWLREYQPAGARSTP